jgi:hypothetical protein
MEKVVQPVATTPVVIATNSAYPATTYQTTTYPTTTYPAVNQPPTYPSEQTVVQQPPNYQP